MRLVRRDYDPRVGRFTAPDPLGDTGGDHDLFEYCVDDPVNAVDPTGEFAFALCGQWPAPCLLTQGCLRRPKGMIPFGIPIGVHDAKTGGLPLPK